MGIGVALLPMPFAFASIKSGELVRLLPGWYGDAGSVSIYYSSKRMLPSKTRAFVDFVLERFRSAEQLIGYAGLAAGVRQSDRTRRDGRIGGGGTDGRLRHYLIEASIWARMMALVSVSVTGGSGRRARV